MDNEIWNCVNFTCLDYIVQKKKKLTYFAIQKKGILTSITLSLAQSASKAISKEERYIMQNLL
jgi:hypothetical protein